MRVSASASEPGPKAAFFGHGGRLRAAMTAWPGAPRPWLDLSTGVNPHPYPAPGASRSARGRLPDPATLGELETAAAVAFGAPGARVCATAGAEAALRLVALTLTVRSAAVVGPTYGGHASAWSAVGVPVTSVAHSAEAEAEAVVVVNPNNPDGRRLSAGEVRGLAERLTGEGRWLIVDESFVETAPELSIATHAGAHVVVLRSFGKFYGLAGLRLGFVLGPADLLARLRSRQGEWPVSVDALAAGLAAYRDPAWADRTRARLARDAARLAEMLTAADYEVVGGAPLFVLARAPDAALRFERLARLGVLVRPFEHARDQLRFGLPPRHAWRRLQTALKESAG